MTAFQIVYLLLIAIRCIGFGSIPGGFNQDGAMAAVDALALAQYGTDRFGTFLPSHFTAWGYGQMSVLMSYFMVPFIKLFGLNSVTVRLPILIASVAAAAAVYGLVKKMISPKAAIVVLVFLAINPWHFMQSRWALDCNMFPHMFVIGLYFLQKGIEKSKYIYVSMIFFALCMYSYGVAFYMVPLFLLTACIVLSAKKQVDFKQVLIAMAVYFGISFPIYGTMLINFMKWDTVKLPFVTMPYFEGSIRTNDILFFSEQPIQQILNNIKSLINVAFLQKPDLIWNAIDDFGTVYKCSMPFVFWGIGIVIYQIKKEQDSKKKSAFILLLLYWIFSVFVGICINGVNVNRINIIFYAHIIFAGITIYYLIQKWKKLMPVFVLVYGIQSVLFFDRYFTVWAQQMETVFYDDFLEAVAFAGEHKCDYYYITPDVQYKGSANVSEILTMFILEIDAEYFQGKTNSFGNQEIAYRERFIYRNPVPEEINAEKNAAYIVRTESLSEYNEEIFAIREFDTYSVVVSRKYAWW